MNFYMTWEIGILLDEYFEKVQQLSSDKAEKFNELYAQAIELTCKDNCGLIMPIDLAIDWVNDRSINDYDGHGYLLDKDGGRIGSMCCNASFLQKSKEEDAVFVAWYNK